MVSKTQKVRVFTEENMRHLGNLYHWKGVHGIKTWKKFGDKSQEETSMEVWLFVIIVDGKREGYKKKLMKNQFNWDLIHNTPAFYYPIIW